MRRNWPISSTVPRLMDLDIRRPAIYGYDDHFHSQHFGPPQRSQQLFSQMAHTNVSLVQAFCVPVLPSLQPLSEDSIRRHSLVFSGIPCPPKSIKSVALQRKFYFQAVYHILDTLNLPAYVQSCFGMGRAHFVSYLGYQTRLVKVILDNSHDADYIVQQFARLKKSNRFGPVLNGVAVRHSLPEGERPQRSSRNFRAVTPPPGKQDDVVSRPCTPMDIEQAGSENISPALSFSPVTSVDFYATGKETFRDLELVASEKVGETINFSVQEGLFLTGPDGSMVDPTSTLSSAPRSSPVVSRSSSPTLPPPKNARSSPMVTPLVINTRKGKVTKRRLLSAGANHSPTVTLTSLKKSLASSSVKKPEAKLARMEPKSMHGNQVNQNVLLDKVS